MNRLTEEQIDMARRKMMKDDITIILCSLLISAAVCGLFNAFIIASVKSKHPALQYKFDTNTTFNTVTNKSFF